MRTVSAGLSALALVLTLSACTGDQPEAGSTPTVTVTVGSTAAPDTTTETAKATDAATDAPAQTGESPRDADLADHVFAVTAEDAWGIATREVQGTVHEIEIEWENRYGAWIWEVEVDDGAGNEHDIKVNADTGEVVDVDVNTSDDTDLPIDLNDPMTFEVARDKALAARPGRIQAWKLAADDDKRYYEFDVVTAEVMVDVDTGRVSID